MMKTCSKCRIKQEMRFFVTDNRQKDKLSRSCKKCRSAWFKNWRNTSPIAKLSEQRRTRKYQSSEKGRRQLKHYDLKKNYGFSIAGYEALLLKQDNACAICAKSADKSRFGVLAVDHDHISGEIRGLLCNLCNVGLGHFQDNSALLDKASSYLLQNKKFRLIKGNK